MKGIAEWKVDKGRLVRSDTFDGKFGFEASPHKRPGLKPKYLVIHYTEGPSASGAIAWFQSTNSRASAHLIIERDGSMTQMVGFDEVAFHAGDSYWDGLRGLNQHSIGIELVNAGRLKRSNGSWVSSYGKKIYDNEVVVDTHKFDKVEYGWHDFPEIQLAVASEISSLLMHSLNLLDVVGHDDISPLRKWDPGPAFPMDSFRSRVTGREENEPPEFEIAGDIRLQAMSEADILTPTESVLSKDTRVEVLERTAFDVRVLVSSEGNNLGRSGWVSNRAIKRIIK